MTVPSFNYIIEPLSSEHNRDDFCCGIEALDLYLKKQARQDLLRFLTAVFILQDLQQQRIAGYYTLAATAIELTDLPNDIIRKLPKYPLLPATLLGRLAIDKYYQGQGLGTFLLFDALHRSKNNEVASMAIVVDAKNEQVQAFYEYHQFTPFPSQPLRLYLPMATIFKMLA
ncbi:GNAT family N-acetyltransferase [Anabaena cylindrica FACHB-243]|uniref:GCN5-related N-acetyltransferase n=1 Tax=Anabaena cylindrica (strain ATCC 27899 / PCC 7122) TaxID=272123 RepID=K9ZB11_ANACC|nr:MULTISPECIES: GNAT family N-acetyltransferase [Anabaena]AFZ56388.1 GCN5-related N-acetyltransferase [Anabaena cylindrica PCC 7122]MBD2418164.1 GNAT family N-acetyltransferase [Anabaena cylindrica FACHB-243]MBY5282008.1 GNAT family N-acetyltransferase [Anabaena sp. CCAP 1446/1C]MBY5309280.1 GNAT family N-acetyltransferase [Anabaena sp. CCAP 1446/1C]MCM2409114.1 GNAT family N-acetyltransferase [Anabaena sp. CCAP 1446/1C]